MVAPPFNDSTPKNSFVISLEEYGFLEVATEIGGTVQSPPDVAFEVGPNSDQGPFVKIVDPDGNEVTGQWATKQLDPADPDDEWDDTHATYVGFGPEKSDATADTTDGSTTVVTDNAIFTSSDAGKKITGPGIPSGTTIASVTSSTEIELSQAATATQTDITIDFGTENIGLFHDGAGHVAQKIQVPSDAEVTTGTDRNYTVYWRIKKSDSNFLTGSEVFNVAEAGTLTFDSGTVSISDVKRAITTSLSDAEINDAIDEGIIKTDGKLAACGVDTSSLSDLPAAAQNYIKTAYAEYARALIMKKDLSAQSQRVVRKRQGNKSVRYNVSQESPSEDWKKIWMHSLEEICNQWGDDRTPKANVTTRNHWTESL